VNPASSEALLWALEFLPMLWAFELALGLENIGCRPLGSQEENIF
jgi:hypothetical protein